MSDPTFAHDQLPSRGRRNRRRPDEVEDDPYAQEAALALASESAAASASAAALESRSPSMRSLDAERSHAANAIPLNTCYVNDSSVRQYEFLDHTADVQIHSWGRTLSDAFENCGLAMFNYMTDLELVSVDHDLDKEIEASAHDMESLLFAFMDELLFTFHSDGLTVRELEIVEFDRESWKIRAKLRGETFNLAKHTQGTEVKAITYSNLQIWEHSEDRGLKTAEIFMIVDI